MKKLIQWLFGPARPQHRPAPSQSASLDNPPTITEGSENAIRRQLVQVLLRDLLRRSGIPSQWVECQMLVVSSRSKGTGMYVRLVVKHWDTRLMNYTFAFQNELTADILRIDPQAAGWLHGISWQLEVAKSCPVTRLPLPQFWAEAKQPEVKATLPQSNDVQRTMSTPSVDLPSVDSNDPSDDLEKLFAIRDRELDRQAAHGVMPVGYEKTQPSPL